MKFLESLPKSRPLCEQVNSRSLPRVALSILLLSACCLPIRAGEITALRDAQGRCVYVNSEDSELRRSVSKGGVTAALRLIDQRKSVLQGIDEFIQQASLEQRLDPALVKAIIQVESAWNTKARSQKGALGLMQLMPETSRRFGVRDPYDPRENIIGGTRYLRSLLDRFHENLRYSLAAYNAGEKAVASWGDVPPFAETRTYLQRISMIYVAREHQARLAETAISRKVQGNRVIYANVD